MKTTDFNKLLIEEHKARGNVILESICHDLTKEQRKIVEGIYKTFEPLMEVTLNPTQIQQVFQQVDQAKGNRTLLGKGVDVAKQVNDTVNKVGTWLQNTTPVQGFDAKFEQLKQSVRSKMGEDNAVIQGIDKLGQLAKDNPGKTAAIIGVLTTIASLAGTPAAGAVVGGILRGTTELLKGEKLSTTIGKGLKGAAYGWLAGKSMEAIGKMVSGIEGYLNPLPMRGSQGFYQENVGNGLPSIYRDANIYGTKEQVNQFNKMFRDAISKWNSGDFEGARAGFDTASKFGGDITAETLKTVGEDPGKTLRLINDVFTGLAAAAQGAATGATAMDKNGLPATDSSVATPAQAESRKPKSVALTESQILAVFDRVERINNKMLSEGRLFEAAKPKAQPTQTANTAQPAPAAVQQPTTQPAGQTPAQPKQGLMGKVGSALGKGLSAVGKGLGKVGHAMTTKVTGSALQKAWEKAGSPTDSVAIEKLLQAQGVNYEVINTVFQANKIPVTIKPTSAQGQTPAVFTPGGNRQGGSTPTPAPSTNTTSGQTPATPTAAPAARPTATPAGSPAPQATGTTSAAPQATAQPAQTAPAPITAADIKKAIPTMKIGDLRGIKKSIDYILDIQDRKKATGKKPKATTAPKAPPAPKATKQPTAQTSQDATKAALKARQASGVGAYESLDYATFKQRLQEAKAQ